MLKHFVPVILLFFCITSVSFADSFTEKSIKDFVRESGYSESEQAAIVNTLTEAEAAGFDSTMLFPRIKEAKAKKVSAQRLISVLKKEIERLISAESILSQIPEGKAFLKNQASLLRAANLIAWGAEEAELLAIVTACKNRPEDFQQATILFVSLVTWGLERGSSLELTEAAALSKLKSRNFPGIQELLVRGRGNSIPPEKLAFEIIKALPEITNFSELKRRILYE